MEMITDQTINNISDQLGSNDLALEAQFLNLSKEQPGVMQFLFQENYQVLKSEEHEYLLYIALVIYASVKSQTRASELVPVERLEEQEDLNWEIWEQIKSKNIRDKNDIFFQDFGQEDLLAFVEDMVLVEEDSELSGVAQEICMVAGKTLIDCLTGR